MSVEKGTPETAYITHLSAPFLCSSHILHQNVSQNDVQSFSCSSESLPSKKLYLRF